MDTTLNSYINRANEINHIYEKTIKKSNQTQKFQNELTHMIHYLESTLKKVKEQYEKIAIIEIDQSKKFIPSDKIIKSANKASINSILARNMPSVELTYVNELNQYCIKINNLLLRGNIGNIYDKKIINNSKINVHQVVICANRNNCKNILSNQYCKFYHDPIDLYQLKDNKIISDEFYYMYINYTRNFSNTSRIYSQDLSFDKNMRCIGSKSSLMNDILRIKTLNIYKNQIENMKHQVMHDLLILLKLSEHGLA